MPVARYGTPGTPELTESIEPLVRDHDAILMANHGVVTYGPDLLTAFLRMETTEHFARVALVTELLGKQNLLSQRDVEKLVTARTHYVAGAQAGPEEHPTEPRKLRVRPSESLFPGGNSKPSSTKPFSRNVQEARSLRSRAKPRAHAVDTKVRGFLHYCVHSMTSDVTRLAAEVDLSNSIAIRDHDCRCSILWVRPSTEWQPPPSFSRWT